MKRHLTRDRWLFGMVVTLGAMAVVIGGMLLAGRGGTNPVWLGWGAGLQARVAARLEPTGTMPVYGSDDLESVASRYVQPIDPVQRFEVVSVRTENRQPLWASLLDDDPTYALKVEVEVEYANGSQARLLWSTWQYGWSVGPVVISYGDGPPGELKSTGLAH